MQSMTVQQCSSSLTGWACSSQAAPAAVTAAPAACLSLLRHYAAQPGLRPAAAALQNPNAAFGGEPLAIAQQEKQVWSGRSAALPAARCIAAAALHPGCAVSRRGGSQAAQQQVHTVA